MPKNFRIISNAETSILVKNNKWYTNATQLESNNTYLVLYNHQYYTSYSNSTLSMYNIKSRTSLKRLQMAKSTDIHFVLHMPNTNTLILWTEDNEWNLSQWNLSTNERKNMAHINCGSSQFGLELDPKCRQSQFLTISADWSRNWIHVKTWNSDAFKCQETLKFQSYGVEWAKVNHFTRNLIALTFTPRGRLKIWDMNSLDKNGSGRLIKFIQTTELDSRQSFIQSSYDEIQRILIRKNSQNQFVTSQTVSDVFSDRNCFSIIRMWYEDRTRKTLFTESLHSRSKLVLFDLNVNEFMSMNQLNGVIRVWCWNTGVCLKSWNTNECHVSSCFYESNSQKLIFTSETLCENEFNFRHQKIGVSYLTMFDLISGKVMKEKKSNEHKIENGSECLAVVSGLSIESCKFM